MFQNKTFIIAELSANHNHKKEIALESIKAAKEAGADAVKIQTYTADTITLNCDNEYFQIKQGTLWDGTTLYKLYQQAYTPWEWHKELFDYAKEIGIPIFSTPFDKTAVDFLEELNNPIIKIASFELVDIPLIEYAASKGKPMIMSTGIATLQEIQEAVDACRKVGNEDITLLKCTSSYPAPLNEANLLTIPDMEKRFGCKVGLSDHTTGNVAACTAVALGAKVIEKHFIIDRSIGGPDAAFSMTKDEFAEMVKRVRETEECLGQVSYELSEKMKSNRKFARSLFACADIKKGEIFTEQNIRSVRPSAGCSPKYLPELLGKASDRDYKRGEPIVKIVQNDL
jgi:pseudaminic acid synthase